MYGPGFKWQFFWWCFLYQILFLPVAHPELNPIEMIWGCMKREVAKSNFDFKLAALEAQATTEMEKIWTAIIFPLLQALYETWTKIFSDVGGS